MLDVIAKNIPDTDVKPADDYAIMAAQAWVRAWHIDQASERERNAIYQWIAKR